MSQLYWKRDTFFMLGVNVAVFLAYLILNQVSPRPELLSTVLKVAIIFNGGCLLWSILVKSMWAPPEE